MGLWDSIKGGASWVAGQAGGAAGWVGDQAGAAGDWLGAGVTDVFSAETVNPYQADPNAFAFDAGAQGDLATTRYLTGSRVQAADALGAMAAQQASGLSAQSDVYGRSAAGAADAGRQGSNLLSSQLIARGEEAQGRGTAGSGQLAQVAGQYAGTGGIVQQQGAMNRLGTLAGGGTAAQQGTMGTAGQLAQMGQRGFQPMPQQQASIDRAIAAQQQTADTSGLRQAGNRMMGLANAGTAQQTAAADRLGRMASGDIAGQAGIRDRLTAMGRQDIAGQGAAAEQLSGMSTSDLAGQQANAARMQALAGGDIAGQQAGIQGLEQFTQQPAGPSAAEAQLRSGADRAIAGQMALSRSGRGAGGSAALRQGQANAAAIQQQLSGQTAELRAQETAQRRAQDLQALSTAQGARATLGGQQLGALQAAQQGLGTLSGQQLQAAQASQQARATLGGQQLNAMQAAAGAAGTLGGQQLGAAEAAMGGYGAATQNQLAALQGAAQTQAQALSAEDAAQARGLQALGIEASQAQALGAQALQGQAQQTSALQAANQAYQAQAALQAQAAQAQAGAGAQYSGQQLQAAQANVAAQQQQQQINDALRLGLLGQGQTAANRGLQYAQLGQQGQLDFARLGQSYQQAGIANALQAQQIANQAGMGYGALTQGYNTQQLQAQQAYQTLMANQSIGAQTANQQADLTTDAGITGMAGGVGGALIGAFMSDSRAKKEKARQEGMADAFRAIGRSQGGQYSGAQNAGWSLGSAMGGLAAKGLGIGESSETPASDALAKAPPYSFEYKSDYTMGPYGQPTGTQYGQMAQDLESTPIGASVVRPGPGGMKTIDTGRLAMVDAAATGEQATEIERLKQRLAQLEGKYGSMV